MFLKKIKSKTGFSLIEIMVSTFMLVMIAAAFTLNYNSSNKRFKLVMEGHNVVSKIRAIQNDALASEIEIDNLGIYFETGSDEFIIFIDANGNDRYATSEKEETIKLEDGIEIESIRYVNQLDIEKHSASDLHIVFSGIESRANIASYSGGPNYVAEIDDYAILELKDGTSSKFIKLTTFGLIDLDN